MTSEPGRGPVVKRGRRRLLVAGVVGLLLLAAGGWWIARPETDPRFVGSWDAYMVLTGPADHPLQPSQMFARNLILDAVGSGSCELMNAAGPGQHLRKTVTWWRGPDYDFMMQGDEDAATDLWRVGQRLAMRVLGKAGNDNTEWQLVNDDPDRRVLQSKTFGGFLVLVRRKGVE
jgi:hypothetical protein